MMKIRFPAKPGLSRGQETRQTNFGTTEYHGYESLFRRTKRMESEDGGSEGS
jgi:hypothetical protein